MILHTTPVITCFPPILFLLLPFGHSNKKVNGQKLLVALFSCFDWHHRSLEFKFQWIKKLQFIKKKVINRKTFHIIFLATFCYSNSKISSPFSRMGRLVQQDR